MVNEPVLFSCSCCCQEVGIAERETSGTSQAKKRALLGQKDRLRLLKKMQSGKERVQQKMGKRRGATFKGEDAPVDDDATKAVIKPVARELRYDLITQSVMLRASGVRLGSASNIPSAVKFPLCLVILHP